VNIYTLHQGNAPLLISLPHNGHDLPLDLRDRLTPTALRTPDTDWHIAQLYDFAHGLGASMLVPRYSRYVVDLNRPPDGAALYPGQGETGLCPTSTFAREPIYQAGLEPAAAEIQARVQTFWQPYHAALQDELARIKAAHGRALLWEAHSIRSVVPMFFDGRLPDFNLGTANGASCSPQLQARLAQVLETQQTYSWVFNGRFKGGYITRRYANPSECIDAVQLELAQLNYMDEDGFDYLAMRAAPTQALIRHLLEAALR
jgi:N-formylglutamate deformylase